MTIREFHAKTAEFATSIKCTQYYCSVTLWQDKKTPRYEVCFYSVGKKDRNISGSGDSPSAALEEARNRILKISNAQEDIDID